MASQMIKIQEAPDAALRTWRWCQDAFASRGRKLTFPKHTDPRKTYQWRYAAKLAQKLEEWGFDDSTAKTFINFAVDYVSEKRLLHKGLSVFFQSNMLEVCYERIQKHATKVSGRLEQLRLMHRFVTAKCAGNPLVSVLLNRDSFDKFRNIVQWFENGQINVLYLSLSLGCTAALSRLDIIAAEERSLLPPKSELYCLAIDFIKDEELRSQVKAILGSDWRELCPRQ